MKCQSVPSILTTLLFLLGLLVSTEGEQKSRLIDLISGITRTSRDVIVGTVGRVRRILPEGEIIYPDDTVIYELIVYLKEKLKHPHPTLDLPALDPFVSNHMDFNITHKIIGQLTLNLERINITKVSQFDVNSVRMRWLQKQLEFNISFPEVQFTGNYSLGGILGDMIPLRGDGPATISASNINATGTLYLGIQNKFLYINKLELNYTIGAFHINLTNLMGGGKLGELLNKILSEDGNTILELVRTDVTHLITNWLHSAGNEILGKMYLSLNDIIDFLQTVSTKKVKSLLNFNLFKGEI